MNVEIIPTVVPAAFSDIPEVSQKYSGFTSFFQIDVADGNFAPNTTWLPSKEDKLPEAYGYEVHLMVAKPASVGTLFAEAGAHALIAHVETLGSAEQTKLLFEQWKALGVKQVGVAALLQTPLEMLEPYLPLADFILLMTIARIGVQGIPYDPNALARVAEMHARHPDVVIAVDGGVSEQNIESWARAGASRFGVGSAIAKAGDPAEAHARLKVLAQGALAPNDALPLTGQA